MNQNHHESPHWAVPYIGIPWTKTGTGPDSFYCWSLVRHVQLGHFNRMLPEIPNTDDLMAIARVFSNHREHRRWGRVDAPVEGDCVQMRRGRCPIHIGVWLDVDGGGVLHCAQDCGVVFQSVAALNANGWSVEGYYHFNGECL